MALTSNTVRRMADPASACETCSVVARRERRSANEPPTTDGVVTMTAATTPTTVAADHGAVLTTCEECMTRILHGDLRVVPNFASTLFEFIAADAPHANDRTAFLAHVALRTQAVLASLFRIAHATELTHTAPAKQLDEKAHDDRDDEPPGSFFAPSPIVVRFIDWQSLPAIVLGFMLAYATMRAFAVGAILSSLRVVHMNSGMMAMLAIGAVASSSGYDVATFACGYSFAQTSSAYTIQSPYFAFAALALVLALPSWN
jgi:hypothetical protein